MNDKEHIETHVARIFLEVQEGKCLATGDLCFGDPQKCEPDILYQDMGIEIGAVLKGTNTQIDVYEKKFLSAATQRIAGKIPETIQIKLVMQDDMDTIQHSPLPAFQNYKYLPKYLDGIFICHYSTGTVNQKVVLNQKTRMRELTFPKNPNSKEFTRFIDELAEFVNTLKQSDFTEHKGYKLHHSVVTEGKVVKNPSHPLDDFVSPKIIEKLSKDKYTGSYTKQILLLHNYSVLGNREFTSDIHFYTHHRNDIFNLLWKQINEHKSFNSYSDIFFLDFSVCAFNSNSKLVDFRDYSLRVPSDFLHGYDEIRCDLSVAFPQKKQR